jgi:hypothetical protein
MISKCIRCGKCKADCCVYHPGSNLFFHPRNKNLAIGSLIEALLYDMQRSHLPRFNQLKNLEEIADHCTCAANASNPARWISTPPRCPFSSAKSSVNSAINTPPLATLMSLHYLKIRNRIFNSLFRKTVVEWGSDACSGWRPRPTRRRRRPSPISAGASSTPSSHR